jgi:hypothetical protein
MSQEDPAAGHASTGHWSAKDLWLSEPRIVAANRLRKRDGVVRGC